MRFQRFLSASQFVKEIEPLHVYRGEFVGTNLLEALEAAGLVIPKLRRCFPDPVARRFWLESHNRHGRVMTDTIEPDGERWEAAVDLKNALFRWQNQRMYGRSLHPLDDPEPRFTQFLEVPNGFQPWHDRRVDVSNSVEKKLFDSTNIETFYTTWQVLLAAEVADAGIFIRLNLADDKILADAVDALREEKKPNGDTHFRLLPVHAARGFKKHENAMNAVVWFAEECGLALDEVLKEHHGGRFRLTEAQHKQYLEACADTAKAATTRFDVKVEDLVLLGTFLGERWADWNREGRPHIADAYRNFLGETIRMVQPVGGFTYTEIRDRVGQAGGWFKPILDVVWPDWSAEERERVRLTLQSAVKERNGVISDSDIDAFVTFLSQNGLEAFFWRLNSFEEHAFRGNEFAIEGMKSDVQGMAVAVEHVVGSLGTTVTQLYEKFKQLWRDPDVLALLKRGDIAGLARQARLAQDWPSLKASIEALRNEKGGAIVADLVMAHRIRGGVHSALPEDDQFELESQFVGLMRAALYTFIEVQRYSKRAPQKPESTKSDGQQTSAS